MSDSDSQSNQSFNLGEIPEEQQSHVKQILQKGRKILPSYDQSSLYNLYKRYYSVDHIFYNELNIIAKRLRENNEEGNEGKNNQDWVTVGRKVRTKVNKSKYNFLDDKQLIKRAEMYLKNKSILPEKRQDNRQQFNKFRENQEQNKQQKYKYQDRRPKQKFVQKVEEVKPVKSQNQKNNHQSQNKSLKYVEKVEKVEKEVPKKQEQVKVPIVESKKPETVVATLKKQEPVVKKAQQPKQTEAPREQKVVNVPVQSKAQPIKQKPQSSQLPSSLPSSTKIIVDETYDAKVASKNFQEATKQNSFILSFIKPQPYPQRVSYIRTANNDIKNVQIRVAGTVTNNN